MTSILLASVLLSLLLKLGFLIVNINAGTDFLFLFAVLYPFPVAFGLYFCLVIIRLKAFSPEIVSSIVFNRISDFIFFLDHNGKLFTANKFSLDNLKYNTYEIQRFRLDKLFSESQKIEELFSDARRKNKFPEIAMDIYTKNGTPIPVVLSFVKIEDQYRTFLGMVIIGVDYRQKIKLKDEVEERLRNERKLSEIRRELEVMVEDRTHELFLSNEKLRQEILERNRAEQQIKADLNEKVRLVQEIHHRVKNNIQIIISLINMLGNHKDMTPDSRITLSEMAERVRSISSIHEDFYSSPNLSRINFSRFLRSTTEDIYRGSGQRRNIIFRLNVSEEYLGIDQAIPCGIIFYELLKNTLKHAFPSGDTSSSVAAFFTVNVEFFRNGDEYTLVVRDNGIGISDKFDIQNPKSTGFQLINVLVKQHLKGKLILQNQSGALFIVKFSA